jgi:scyllo-inositol 2-dehydrogenase (NAD+)
MSEALLKASLVGCGRIGAFTRPELRDSLPAGWLPLSHADAIRATPGYALAALCDVDAQLLDKAAATHGVAQTFADYREMVGTVRPDVVSIATRTAGRCEMIEFVAQHGVRGVHCEKPISTNIGDCRRALAALQRNNVQVSYGALRRYMDVFRQVRAMVSAGEIGEIVQVEVQVGRTLLLWNHPHSVDLLLFFAGTTEVDYVQASCTFQEGAVRSPDLVDDEPMVEHATIRFANGVTGCISPVPSHSVVLYGTKGAITVGANGAWIDRRISGPNHSPKPTQRIVPQATVSGRVRAFEELRDAILSGAPCSISPDEILQGQRILMAMVASSLRDGARLRLDEVSDDFKVSGKFGTNYP